MNNVETILETMQRDIQILLNQQSEDLWAVENIALYFKLSKKAVQNHYITNPTFPKPVKLVTGGKRWVPKEVKAWALKHR